MSDAAERSLKLELRGRKAAAAGARANCDQCRKLHASCDKTQPCVRCTKAGRKCTFDDKLMKCGRMSHAERLSFAASGLKYHTFRDTLRSKRERRRQPAHHEDASTSASASSASPAGASTSATVPSSRKASHRSVPSGFPLFPPATPRFAAPPSVQAALSDPRIEPLLLDPLESASIARSTSASAVHGTPLPPEFAHDTSLRYYRFSDELVTRPMPLYVEQNIPSGQHGILYVHASGYLVLSHAEHFAPTYQDVLAREWSTEGAGGQIMSPFVSAPEPREGPAPLWPAGRFTEEDYDILRSRAAALLSCPAVPQLLESSFFEQEAYLTLYGPDIASEYAFACRPITAIADERLAARQRYVQASLLFNLAYAARHEDKIRLSLPTSSVEIGASPWALAVDGFKLAWALCQPREGLRLTGPERSVEALVAINMAKMITITNPRCRLLSTAAIFLDPELHQALTSDLAGNKVAQEMYKRTMAHRMWAQRSIQINSVWAAAAQGEAPSTAKARTMTNPFIPILDHLVSLWGPLVALPGEAREYGCGGLASRWRIAHFLARARLVRLTEVIIALLASREPPYGGGDIMAASGATNPDAATTSDSPPSLPPTGDLADPRFGPLPAPSQPVEAMRPPAYGMPLHFGGPSVLQAGPSPRGGGATSQQLLDAADLIKQLVRWSEEHLSPSTDVPLAGTFDAYDMRLMIRDRAREYVHTGRWILSLLPSSSAAQSLPGPHGGQETGLTPLSLAMPSSLADAAFMLQQTIVRAVQTTEMVILP